MSRRKEVGAPVVVAWGCAVSSVQHQWLLPFCCQPLPSPQRRLCCAGSAMLAMRCCVWHACSIKPSQVQAEVHCLGPARAPARELEFWVSNLFHAQSGRPR